MAEPAKGTDVGVDRFLAATRRAGYTWKSCRCGIVCKTPKNAAGKHATTIWYGQHEVTWNMVETRPTAPENPHAD